MINNNIITIKQENLENFLKTDSQYNHIWIETSSKILNPDELKNLSNNLNFGGKLSFNLSEDLSNADEIAKLFKNLRLSGYVELEKSDDNKKASGTKKIWNKSKKTENPWKKMEIENKSELVLEKDLIDPFDSYQKFAKADDCITRPKPCKNCTCGRAETENNKVEANFKSDCGKCYLGDAFRCAGCPYRGKPAFEPGDKIQFSNSSNPSDNLIEEEKSNLKLSNQKVKIDI
jgi:hypothetical protein